MNDLLAYFGDEMIAATLSTGGDGSYVNGKWVPGASSDAPALIVEPQPLSSEDLQNFEDAEHARDYLKSWTASLINTRRLEKDSDIVTIDTRSYKVVQVAPWAQTGGLYWFIMREITEDE